jgi:putative N6-adenine-specific DNA methylase
MQGADYALSYAPLRIKDALCDEFRKRGHPRPNVGRTNPGVRLRAYFRNGRCELSVDLCGEALHKRGYRKEGAEAPLRENRAAALLRFCGYDGLRPLIDPFCGSGTVAIEAALIATRTSPGLLRTMDSFAAVRLFPDAEAALREEYQSAGEECLIAPTQPITGSDTSTGSVETALANAAKAGATNWITFKTADAREIDAANAWIVCNPPYGERLEDPAAAVELIRTFVRRVKHHCVGSRLGLVVPRGDLEKAIGLRPERKLTVESGSLCLRYLCYEIQSGSYRGRDSAT